MNQDGLENFFGNVRSNCQVKMQPMPFQFRSAFTNLIVSNMSAKHSIRSNCQDDKGFALLQNVIDIYDMDEGSKEEFKDDEDIIELDMKGEDEEQEELSASFLREETLLMESANVCGKVLAKNECEACENTLKAYVPLDSHEKSLSQNLTQSLNGITLKGLGCPEHASVVYSKIKKEIVQLNIDIFRKEINSILCNRALQPFEGQPDIYSKAFTAQNKRTGKYSETQKTN